MSSSAVDRGYRSQRGSRHIAETGVYTAVRLCWCLWQASVCITRRDCDEFSRRLQGGSRVSIVGCDLRTTIAQGGNGRDVPLRLAVVPIEACAAAVVAPRGGDADRGDRHHRPALLGQPVRDERGHAAPRHAVRRRHRPRCRQSRQRAKHGLLHVERRRHLHVEEA